MSVTPKTIQIYLPGGDPHGLRIAEITTRIVQVVEVPRSLLSEFLKRPESGRPALYFLVSAGGEAAAPRLYVGQSGDLPARLADHNKKKEFWERALVLVSLTNSLTPTHTLFLEWHCIQQAAAAGRYALENGNSGSRPHTPEPLEADCLEIFETARTLLATLGHPLFDPIGGSAGPERLYFLTVKGTDGRARYTPEGFVVLGGSIGKRHHVPTFSEANQRTRRNLVEAGVMREEGDTVRFVRDHVFGSPSTAAMVLLGRTSNGWKEWKSADGVSLDELERGGPDTGGA